MKIMTSACLILLASVFAMPALLATAVEDGVSARLSVPQGEFTVGDAISLRLTVTHPPGTTFEIPAAQAIEKSAVDEGESPGEERFFVEKIHPLESNPPRPDETSWIIRLRPFVPGAIEIPALDLTYRLPGSVEARTVLTDEVTIPVASVLGEGDEEPSDIKGPWRLPLELGLLILLTVLALIAAAVAWYLWRRSKRRRPLDEVPEAEPEPVEPPYVQALRELEELLRSRLLEEGKTKEFHVSLSEIVKRFLAGQHRFAAQDRTTEEILLNLARPGVEPGVRQQTRRLLIPCDLVKFAKRLPSRGEIDETVDVTRVLIETGRPPREDAAA